MAKDPFFDIEIPDGPEPKQKELVKCGNCRHFVRDGKCAYYTNVKDANKKPFGVAPFWVWSDCYSDREQVRSDVESRCVVYKPKGVSHPRVMTTACMRCDKVHEGAQSEIWALGWAVPLDVTKRNGERGFMCGECYALLVELRRVLAEHHERELRLFMDGAE